MFVKAFRLFPFLILAIALAFFIFNFTLQQGDQAALVVEDPIDYMLAQRLYPYGEVDKAAYQSAIDLSKSDLNLRSSIPIGNWKLRGPYNVGGRITDIEMPYNSLTTIYAGSASGGVYKSIDGGENFQPIFDEAKSLSIGDLDIAETDTSILYVGTGEANAGGGSLAYDGYGVYKSINGGVNWTHLGLENVGSIGKVVISKQNPDVVYVAAMGELFKNNSERGVYKTSDGGESWEQVLYISDSTGVIDLVIHPQDDNIVYAAAWERIRRPYNRQYGGSTSGIYKTTNGGQSWAELTSGLPSSPFEKGRIGLALSRSQPDILYAYYVTSFGNNQGVYRSTNGGQSWQLRGLTGLSNVSFGWWFGKIEVDPNVPDRLYLTQLNMFRSENGGSSWTEIFQNSHVDHHALFINPQNPSLVVNGNDGGIYISQDRGNNHDKVENLPNNQFYTTKIDPHFPDRLYGGLQDNGTYRISEQGDQAWEYVFGGDGFGISIDPFDPATFYVQFQYGNLRRTTTDGQFFSTISVGGTNNWNTPLIIDPHNASTLYTGNQQLFRSDNRGNNWTAVSPILTNANNPSGSISFGTLTSISVSPKNQNYIYVGTDDGNIWSTTDRGANWENVSNGIPNRWITSVAADPNYPTRVYCTVSGFRFGESSAQVFRSDNNGQTWTAIGEGLPDIPVNDIIVDLEQRDRLFIATDVGVYVSINNGDSWAILGSGLPRVPVTDLDYLPEEGILSAATYGRSMYTYQLDQLSTDTKETLLSQAESKLFPNPSMGSTQLQLLAEQDELRSYEIYDWTGKVVAQQGSIHNRQVQVATTHLAQGTYILRFRTKKGKWGQQQLMVI